MDVSRDIRSLSDFKRNTVGLMEQLAETGEPVVLTVNGRAKLIVQDALSYQRLLDALEYNGAVEGIRRGMEDVRLGREKPLSKVFSEIRKKRRPADKPGK